MKIQELNFKNMTVLFDGSKITESVTRKHNLIIIVSSFSIVMLIFAAVYGILKVIGIEQYLWLSVILSCFAMIIILICGLCVANYIAEKITPPHYNVINWLKKHNKEDVCFGWFDEQYIVMINDTVGCQTLTKSLKKFLESDYMIEDLVQDKSKPVFATIDLTNNIPSVCVSNYQ